MTTIEEIIKQIRRNISDTDKVGYDDEELLQWINEANSYIRKIVMQYKPNLLYRRETGTGQIKLKDIPMKVHSVFYNNHPVIYRATLPADIQKGSPYEYYRLGNEICLFPEPSDEERWTVIYLPPQPFYTLGGEIDWVHDFDYVLIEYATIRAQYRNEFMMNQEEELLGSLTQQLISMLANMDNKQMVMEGYWP